MVYELGRNGDIYELDGYSVVVAFGGAGTVSGGDGCAFLTPHPFRGRPNASYMTNYTVRFMAAHREQSLEDLCRIIRANSKRVYGVWGLSGFSGG